MEFFPDATNIRLKSAHGKYLWAEDDHYRTSQHVESKNQKAVWRVERSAGEKTLKLKSCHGAYLTAGDRHHKDLSILAFAGKKVVQMRPENVESLRAFEWEPVIEGSFIKLKTVHATFLRANSRLPPWNNSISHDIPQHEKHQRWLLWEVETVPAPRSLRESVSLESLHASLAADEGVDRSNR